MLSVTGFDKSVNMDKVNIQQKIINIVLYAKPEALPEMLQAMETIQRQHSDVYSCEDCVFKYCPNPEICKADLFDKCINKKK